MRLISMYSCFIFEVLNWIFGPMIYHRKVCRGFVASSGHCLTAGYDHYMLISATNSVLHVTSLMQLADRPYNQEEARQCTYNVTLRRVCATTVAVDEQYVLYILSVYL